MPPQGQDNQPGPDLPQPDPGNYQPGQGLPAPQYPQDDPSRYSFFMESKPKPKKTLLPQKGNKLAWIIISAIALMVILGAAAAFMSSLRSSQNRDNADTFVGIAQQQQEILRVSKLGEKHVRSTDLTNFIATARLTTTTSQQQTISFLVKNGVKVDTKAIAKYVGDANTDKVLASAAAASVYDTTFTRVMVEILTEYQSRLDSLAAKTTTQSGKELVEKNIQHAELLQTMLTKK